MQFFSITPCRSSCSSRDRNGTSTPTIPELGTYLSQIFPFLGVRFIAVNDHYDSRSHAGSTVPIDMAFQTLLYDLYSKDISVKGKTSFESKCAKGEYVFGQVPFGYEKSREVKNMVVVNEKEAKIVRYIFALALNGNGSTQIARILNEKGIPTKMQIRHPERADKDGRAQAWDNTSRFSRRGITKKYVCSAKMRTPTGKGRKAHLWGNCSVVGVDIL